jgi:excisionase family DNA binding protein
MPKQLDTKRSAYSLREIAKRWGCGHDKIYEEVRAGRLRAKKIGKLSRVTADEEERYLAALPDVELGA